MNKFDKIINDIITEDTATNTKGYKCALELAKTVLEDFWTTASKKELEEGKRNLHVVNSEKVGMETKFHLETSCKCEDTKKVIPQKIKVSVYIDESI